jgi:hypothetical protein
MKQKTRAAELPKYELFAVHLAAIVLADFIIRLLVLAYH